MDMGPFAFEQVDGCELNRESFVVSNSALKLDSLYLPASAGPRERKYKAVLFDCDGTLIDSQFWYNVALAEILGRYDSSYDVEWCTRVLNAQSWEVALRKFAWDELDVDEAIAAAVDLARKLILEFAQPLRNAELALSSLVMMGVSVAICSNGEHDAVSESLRRLGLRRYFDDGLIFTRQSVTRTKPDPEMFLKAADALGVGPEDCLVVEDSTTGLLAGARAGMDLIAFLGGAHIKHYDYNELVADIVAASCGRLRFITSDHRDVFEYAYHSLR